MKTVLGSRQIDDIANVADRLMIMQCPERNGAVLDIQEVRQGRPQSTCDQRERQLFLDAYRRQLTASGRYRRDADGNPIEGNRYPAIVIQTLDSNIDIVDRVGSVGRGVPLQDDAAYRIIQADQLTANKASESRIDRWGDYDIFHFTPGRNANLGVTCTSTGRGSLSPILLLYSSDGRQLLGFAQSDSNSAAATLRYDFITGTSCKIVVGALDNRSAGDYSLTLATAASRN